MKEDNVIVKRLIELSIEHLGRWIGTNVLQEDNGILVLNPAKYLEFEKVQMGTPLALTEQEYEYYYQALAGFSSSKLGELNRYLKNANEKCNQTDKSGWGRDVCDMYYIADYIRYALSSKEKYKGKPIQVVNELISSR